MKWKLSIVDNVNQMKTRIFPESNYKAIWYKGKTIRIALDSEKPITELEFPEFYDVKITGWCSGNCTYCYQDSTRSQKHYDISQIQEFFGKLNENEKPFQVALGGGNPNEHPYFIECLMLFSGMGIVPNYPTNGLGLTKEVLEATKEYCGGVAITCHRHMEKTWKQAIVDCVEQGIMVNLHIMISGEASIDYFKEIYEEFKGKVDYFVLLPYIATGRAKPATVQTEYLFKYLDKQEQLSDIAFGANFIDDLEKNQGRFAVSLYPPEILSKYLDLKDMKVYSSSFAVV